MKKVILLSILLLASFLRLYKLASTPPALYWDEASLGYNAYSILKTGHDEHHQFLPTTNFAAFGDYKPPLYIYATVPSIALFGLNEFAIRFPSAFFGILTVLLTYLLAAKLFDNGRLQFSISPLRQGFGGRANFQFSIAHVAALFLAISPWHLQLSRAAFEANLGLFFSTLGILLFLKFATERPWYILPSALSFLAAMYTFTGQRLFVPFILLVLALQFKKQLVANIKLVAATILVAGILFWPLFVFATKTLEGRLRFEEVTIFNDLEPIDRSTRYRQDDNFSTFSSIIHNRRLLYVREYLIHYFDAFNPSFLFTHGDVNPRLSTGEVGQLYYLDLILILSGIYFLFATNQKYRFLVIGWLLVSPLGPATARETPHALRMLHILPTFQLLSAFGLYHLYQLVKFKKLLITSAFLLLTFNFLFYLHMYYSHYPKIYSDHWQYGYKQAVETIRPLYNDADYIVVSDHLGRPYIYFLLYMAFDPRQYWQTAQIVKDRFFFIRVDGFDKFRFGDGEKHINLKGNIIYVLSKGHTPQGANIISTIKNLDGETVFEISQINQN